MPVHDLLRKTICALVLLLLTPAPAFCTSPQIELSEPILTLDDATVHGKVSFGVLAGSDLYNTAGNLGGTFSLGHMNGGMFYFFGDIFTWVHNPKWDSFEPQRIIYTLEFGYYWEHGDDGYRLFAKHQSFHDVDMCDGLQESYELYGASYRRLTRPEFYASLGLYQNRRVVDYRWDLAVAATFDLPPVWDKQTYLHLWLHQVTEKHAPGAGNGFLDNAAEAGIVFDTGVVLFARYECLHDINCFDGITDKHVLAGVRYSW